MHAFPLLAGALAAFTFPGPGPTPPVRWGEDGHQMAARAATATLPDGLPGFFVDAGEQLVYLDPEPDRWRSRPLREMDQAFSYDHYIDLENVPAGALDAPDRYVFIRLLHEAGMERPERDAGFLPFRIVELYQRLVTEWRLWRAETDPQRREWIQQRIVNDAGVLGHYVTDAANPHHSTIHFNGWNADAPNPNGYTTSNEFHWQFESEFVRGHVRYEDVLPRVTAPVHDVSGSARAAVMAHIQASNGLVDTLYRLEKDVGFAAGGALRTETRDFAADRLAAGATMLRDLWWSAWQESATAP